MVAAQLALICKLGIWLQYSLVLCSGLMFAFPKSSSPTWSLYGSLLATLLAVTAQGLLAGRYRRRQESEGQVGQLRVWLGLFTLTSLLAGLSWGIAGFELFSLIDVSHRTFLGLIILGQAMLSVAVSSWYLPTLIAFIIPAVLPTALGFLSAGTVPHIVTGAVALAFMCALIGLGRVLNRQFREGVSRQLDDHDFIERLLTGRASENAVQTRLETALESMSEALAVFDADDRLVICNRRFFGEQRAGQAKDLVGITFDELVRRDVGNAGIVNAIGREAEYVAERIAFHRQQTGTFEIELTGGRWLRVREQRTRDGGTVIVQTDITADKRAEERLRAAKEKAENASRSKSEFLANTSHELRTPLNAIIGFSEIMESQLFGPLGNSRYLQYAKDIHKSGQYLIRIIDDILDLSKIEAGRVDPADDIVDLEQAIMTAVNITEGRAKAGQLTVEVRIAPALPCLRADQRIMQQILLNLLSNALKFTPPNGRVEISAALDRGGDVLIRIADTGIGMNAEDLERAFEPFGRAKGALVRNFEGTGLGLPLCRSLVNLHGGTLDVESAPNVGTVATVRFPARRVLLETKGHHRRAAGYAATDAGSRAEEKRAGSAS